jgi:ribonuclease P protein component
MESLKKNTDFKNCYQAGRSFVNKFLVLYVCGNGLGKNRVGISVSKKVGNSVVRHRTTRLVRESYRLHEQEFESGCDLVFVARVRAKDAGFFEIERALLHLVKKAGLAGSYAENVKKNND